MSTGNANLVRQQNKSDVFVVMKLVANYAYNRDDELKSMPSKNAPFLPSWPEAIFASRDTAMSYVRESAERKQAESGGFHFTAELTEMSDMNRRKMGLVVYLVWKRWDCNVKSGAEYSKEMT